MADGIAGGDWLNTCGVDGFRMVERNHHAAVACVDIGGRDKVQIVFGLGVTWLGGGVA